MIEQDLKTLIETDALSSMKRNMLRNVKQGTKRFSDERDQQNHVRSKSPGSLREVELGLENHLR